MFKSKPKVESGDRIYFVENGVIVGYGVILDCEQVDVPEECDVTGRQWGKQGDWVVRYNDWHWLDSKPKMRGFQGYRYVDRLPDEIREALE